MKILMLFLITFSVQAKEVERLVAVDGYNNLMHNKPQYIIDERHRLVAVDGYNNLMHNKPQATINAANVPSKNYIGK